MSHLWVLPCTADVPVLVGGMATPHNPVQAQHSFTTPQDHYNYSPWTTFHLVNWSWWACTYVHGSRQSITHDKFRPRRPLSTVHSQLLVWFCLILWLSQCSGESQCTIDFGFLVPPWKNENPNWLIKCKLYRNITECNEFDWSVWFCISAMGQATWNRLYHIPL